MAYGYDTRPNLQGYDALTVRGIAKFAAVVVLLFGAQFLADQYGVQRWLLLSLQLVWIAVACRILWIGVKALLTGTELPNAEVGPRYSEPDRISFISPRGAALIHVVFAVALVAITIARLIQILSE